MLPVLLFPRPAPPSFQTTVSWEGDQLVCEQRGEKRNRGWRHWLEGDKLHLVRRARGGFLGLDSFSHPAGAANGSCPKNPRGQMASSLPSLSSIIPWKPAGGLLRDACLLWGQRPLCKNILTKRSKVDLAELGGSRALSCLLS